MRQGRLFVAQIVFAILIATFTGPAPAALAELYPTNVRSTGIWIAYNFDVTIFGGFAPFIATWLIVFTAAVWRQRGTWLQLARSAGLPSSTSTTTSLPDQPETNPRMFEVAAKPKWQRSISSRKSE